MVAKGGDRLNCPIKSVDIDITVDKKALLDELKIDRAAEEAPRSSRQLRTFGLVALLGGGGFVAWFVDFSSDPAQVSIPTAVARAASVPAGDSVLDATGYVVARRQATVSAKVTGKVLEVLIEEGMIVEEGQLLARLDDSIPRAQLALAESQLAAARASLSELDVQLKQARLDLERTEGLAARNLASKADLDRDTLDVDAVIARLERVRSEVEVAASSLAVQRQLVDDMQVRAPFAGVVVAKAAQPGEMISPISAGGGFTRTGICTIVDMDSLEVEVDVNEAYINRVKPRQPVAVSLNAYPDFRIPAEVIAIIPTADRNKATVRVRIALLERDGRVLPDMGVKVAFLGDDEGVSAAAPEDARVLVPAGAIGEDAQGRYVYLVVDERAERRTVSVEGSVGTRVRVSGIAKGDRVVADLSDEVLALLERGVMITERG
jgi:RND family efflux transporter MFP subunit